MPSGKWRKTETDGFSVYLPCPGKSLCHATVSSSVAGGDEVSHAAALEECGGGHGIVFAEEFGESDHLHQAQPDDGCFGVVSTPQTVTEACAHRNNVLKQGQIRMERLLECQNGATHPALSRNMVQISVKPINFVSDKSINPAFLLCTLLFKSLVFVRFF